MRLEELCVRSERCTSELREKLRQWAITPEEADKIIADLQRRRFVDDRRFAEAFTRDHYRFNRWGRRKIEVALRAKRIDAEDIMAAFDTIDEDEYFEVLTSLLSELVAAAPKPLDALTRQKIYRRALARGYESSLIAKVLKSIQ